MMLKTGYYTTNHIGKFITLRQGILMFETGKKVTVKEIETEIANYCSLSRGAIRHIKSGTSQPSLAQAFKIALYFNAEISDLFTFHDDSVKEKENSLLKKARKHS